MKAFRDEFVELFNAHFHRLFRYVDRLTGDPDLATDIAQETFLRLYQRGSLPEVPVAWLVTVANNLFRNEHATHARRTRLLKTVPDAAMFADRAVEPSQAESSPAVARRVRTALDGMPERERKMLLLRAEGYSYKEIAQALSLKEASVGTLLLRAKEQFRNRYEQESDASN